MNVLFTLYYYPTINHRPGVCKLFSSQAILDYYYYYYIGLGAELVI